MAGRRNRSAQQAVDRIAAEIKSGKTQVYDADLSSYFDTIPHDKLILALRKRVTDGGVLSLIRQWLKANSVNVKGVQTSPKGKGTPQLLRAVDGVVERLNLVLDGWGRYFRCGYPSRQFAKVNAYVRKRPYRFLNRKSQRKYRLKYAETYYGEYQKLGLVTLTRRRYYR